MSSVRDAVEVLVRALVDHPDQVHVTEGQHRGATLVEVYTAPGDVGRLIGRQGRTIAALRTLASTAGERDGAKVTLEVRDTPFKG